MYSRTPDAEIDGEISEFKELTKSTKNIRYRLQEGISRAKNQGAAAVIIHINRDSYEFWKINDGIRKAFYSDERQLIQNIILVFNSEEVQQITREEWGNGRRF
ncbi:hypothetical protein [Microcoleus sp. PH2017_05_CCC_O_A]|uniref:CdiA C-terminal domain-containing protein n=1 Tax=Microcoleus sp. PH2017_05_CCC_O_A TaxID=2798816 RepID=UPI001D4443B5|nr:hypothetical protein [Microcoleus sp. PH2017_05_CCC_O_A]MCC3440050.1 hypothetical protein [Microcoleus sp. PH2017_05_CCC_O_A]